MGQDYGLISIGGGSAGLMAASLAIQLDVRVAIVERDRLGGDCTWTGCVPSKTLLKTARVAHQMRTADRFGLPAVEPEIDFKAVMAHVRSIISETYEEESPEALRADGIDVHLGAARFVDPHTVAVGDETLAASHFLIATGAHPRVPPIRGLDEVPHLTYETIWDLEELPPRLLIVGAGPVGCEMAQAFARLGSKVTLISAHDRILPRDEPDASRLLAKVFEAEGIRVVYDARAELAWQDGKGIHVGAGGNGLVGDALLLAAGRQPNVEGLGLEAAGVAHSDQGIDVNKYLRTSQKHIYAAGDCLGGPQFTHYAGWQAAMAVRNALLPASSRGIADFVPWTTFTDPEVAHAGRTEAQARAEFGDRVKTCEWPLAKVDRARTEGYIEGFVQLVHKKDGTLLGATLVAPRAGEMIHEWIVALHQGIKVGEVSNALHVYPTYAIAGMQAAAEIRVRKLLGGASGRVVKGLARLMT